MQTTLSFLAHALILWTFILFCFLSTDFPLQNNSLLVNFAQTQICITLFANARVLYFYTQFALLEMRFLSILHKLKCNFTATLHAYSYSHHEFALSGMHFLSILYKVQIYYIKSLSLHRRGSAIALICMLMFPFLSLRNVFIPLSQQRSKHLCTDL